MYGIIGAPVSIHALHNTTKGTVLQNTLPGVGGSVSVVVGDGVLVPLEVCRDGVEAGPASNANTVKQTSCGM